MELDLAASWRAECYKRATGAFHASAARGLFELASTRRGPADAVSACGPAPPQLSLDAQRWVVSLALLQLVFGRRTQICGNPSSSREKLLRDLFVAVTELVFCFRGKYLKLATKILLQDYDS